LDVLFHLVPKHAAEMGRRTFFGEPLQTLLDYFDDLTSQKIQWDENIGNQVIVRWNGLIGVASEEVGDIDERAKYLPYSRFCRAQVNDDVVRWSRLKNTAGLLWESR
jgi:hypothetical protein